MLFVTISASFPFVEANRSDYHYNLIIDGKWDEFWMNHSMSLNNDKSSFSAEFKDLIQNLICYDPESRLTIN